MGQKTHPKGLRLEVNKNWTSNWFPKKNAYATDLAQDIKLRKYLKSVFTEKEVMLILVSMIILNLFITLSKNLKK